jgi:hypothetical protein
LPDRPGHDLRHREGRRPDAAGILPDYDSISTIIDDPTRDVLSAALGAGAER